jgi:hypothetical protein
MGNIIFMSRVTKSANVDVLENMRINLMPQGFHMGPCHIIVSEENLT